MQYMITRAALLLRAYPTTLEQDQAILKESKVWTDWDFCESISIINAFKSRTL